MKVLHVAASSALSGGGEKHVLDLVEGLRRCGVDSAIVSPPGELPEAVLAAGLPAYEADIAAGYSHGKRDEVSAAVGAYAPDVVHAHGSRAAFFARLADPEAAERVVYTLHGIHIDKAGSRLRRTALLSAEKHLRPSTARFITVCESDLAKGARLGVLDPQRSTVVHNGIPLPVPVGSKGAFREELGVAHDVVLALSVGRFHQQKDQATLLGAWAVVTEQLPSAVLALVGSGPMEHQLRELAVSLGVADSVRFVSPRPSLADAYTDADVFVLSSLWEGLPYVVLEAMAYGLPVVATDVDGVPEAVDDFETGRLVPPGDPDALGRDLLSVLQHPATRLSMGEAGRARVERLFTVEKMVEGTLAVYEGLTAGRTAS